MGSHLNISENSCSTATGADRGRQLEVITHGTHVEVTNPLALAAQMRRRVS